MIAPLRKLPRGQKFWLFSRATSIDPKSSGMKRSAEEQRLVDAMVDRARCLNRAQFMSGPGFYIDRKLREFVLEYNNRVFSGHGSQQPVSFQVFQEFVEPDDGALVLKILPERHYSLDPNFVLDRLTDPSIQRSADDLYEFEDRTIYMVSLPGGYDDLQFAGVPDLALFGWAFVRHGNEISIFALGAKSSPERNEMPLDVEKENINPQKLFLKDSMGDSIDINSMSSSISQNIIQLYFYQI